MEVKMKTLNESIRESVIMSELDEFDKRILSHLTIEYFDKNIYCKTHLIPEKYGTYEDLGALTSLVYRKLLSFRSKNDISKNTFVYVFRNSEFKNLKNVFFNQLELTIITDPDRIGQGNYLSEFSEMNNDTLLFDKVCIEIFTNKWFSDFDIAFQHEMTHAYENWNRQLKNDNKFSDKVNADFYKSSEDNDNIFKKFLKTALYYTLDIERNAFVAELSAVLKRKKDVIKTPLEALEILRNTDIYKTYKDLYLTVIEYENGNIPKENVDRITNEYNIICNTNLTSEKVFKTLKKRIKKSLDKFDTLVSKLCCESLKNISIIVDNWGRSIPKFDLTKIE